MEVNTHKEHRESSSFPLLDLPWELVELLLEHLSSHSLVQLGSCSRQFKDLASSGRYWQALIQKEKKQIICVAPNITDWKEIFKQGKGYDNLNAAFGSVQQLSTYKMILSPGSYEFGGRLFLRPDCQLIGLWDTPWSQKTADQKSIFVCYGDYPFSFYAPNSKDDTTILKHLSFTTHESMVDHSIVTFQANNVLIENCEFNFSALNLWTKEAQYHVKNCLFDDAPEFAVDCKEVGKVVIQDCVFRHCEASIYFDSCVHLDLGPNLIENCLFDESTGICFHDSNARTILKNNIIQGGDRWGVYLEKNCAAELIGCTIKACRTGMMAFENSKISMTDNTLISNEEYALRIRHGVEIQKFMGNKIQHNDYGQSWIPSIADLTIELLGACMPLQDSPEYSEEALLANNTISQNLSANLVLEEKKMPVETLYKDGDSEDTMRANIDVAVERSLCTYSATVTNSIEQIWFECYTCKMGVCPTCVEICHAGHNIAGESGTAECYCDCGSGSNCKALS